MFSFLPPHSVTAASVALVKNKRAKKRLERVKLGDFCHVVFVILDQEQLDVSMGDKVIEKESKINV